MLGVRTKRVVGRETQGRDDLAAESKMAPDVGVPHLQMRSDQKEPGENDRRDDVAGTKVVRGQRRVGIGEIEAGAETEARLFVELEGGRGDGAHGAVSPRGW